MPIAPLGNVSRGSLQKKLKQNAAVVAPRALRNPISRVRSLTATSMMLITADGAQSQRYQSYGGQNIFMASKILPIISAC